jgi:hypothetical protein
MRIPAKPTVLKVVVSDSEGVVHRETVWGDFESVIEKFCVRFSGLCVNVRPTRRASSIR